MLGGKFCLLLSAFVYGIVPVFAKFAYMGGTNSCTLTFLRGALTLPILLCVIFVTHRTLKIDFDSFKKIVVLATVGAAAPIITLYLSYEYISIGLASTLHFIYPLVTVFASAFIYRKKIKKSVLGSVIFVTLGILMFADIGEGGKVTGIILALASGILYSFFVIYIERSGLDKMDYLVLTFYTLVIMSAVTLVFAAVTGSLDFDMSTYAWVNSAGISMLVTFVALPMFQLGVRYSDSATAGIMSGLEPVVSIVAGAVFLGETIGLLQIVGAVLIFIGLSLCKSV